MAISDQHANYLAFRDWLMSDREDNTAERERVKGVALRSMAKLTPTQYSYINAYFFEGLTTVEIAEQYGVNKSTVSRTIGRGMCKIQEFIQIASPGPMTRSQEKPRLKRRGVIKKSAMYHKKED
jgi:RNA polymerase sigma factor (sigma-70 family)